MVDTKRIPLKHSGKDLDDKRAKLAARKMGPFEIIRMINNNAAKLKLPRTMKGMNPTFNVDILSHYVENPNRFETRQIPKTSRTIIDATTGEELYFIEKLLDITTKKKTRYWLVKWQRAEPASAAVRSTLHVRMDHHSQRDRHQHFPFFIFTNIQDSKRTK
jgi:hypothetical protein